MSEHVLRVDDQTESRLHRFLKERKLKRRHGYGVCQLAQVHDLSVWVSKDGKWYSLKDATVDELLDSERSVCRTLLPGILGLSEQQARDVVRRFWTEEGLEGVYTDGKGRYAMVVKLPDSGWDHHDTQLVGTAAAGLLLSGLLGFTGYKVGKNANSGDSNIQAGDGGADVALPLVADVEEADNREVDPFTIELKGYNKQLFEHQSERIAECLQNGDHDACIGEQVRERFHDNADMVSEIRRQLETIERNLKVIKQNDKIDQGDVQPAIIRKLHQRVGERQAFQNILDRLMKLMYYFGREADRSAE
jgi:hypothetical protein